MTPTPLSSREAGWIIFILALGAGFSVASIYYAQPLLPLMGANLHLSVEGMGLVPTLTQAGYALGILFLLPLGDRHDRRTLILLKSAALRVMYQAAALSIALIGLLMWRILPRFAIHSTLSYPQLMKSMAHLWQRYPALRRAALAQGFLSIAFSAFWSTLAVMLLAHYQMGSAVAGGFGIAGAAGALAAPLAGGLADKYGAGRVTQLGAGLVTLSFALMFLMPLLPPHGQLLLIGLSAIGFDLGLQSSLVAHQNLVYSLEPQARGRLNALLFTGVFIGMALGSVLGSRLYVVAGWNGVVVLAVVTGAIALAIRLRESARLASIARAVR